MSALAAANGLDPASVLVAGTSLTLPGGGGPASGRHCRSATHQRAGQSAGGRQVAAEHGVPPSLANAIAEQESGRNNALTSPAGARAG